MQTPHFKLYLLICLIAIAGTHAPVLGQFANTPPSVAQVSIPPAPEAAALAQYVEIPVSWYTGSPSFSLPLWTLEGRDLSLPVALSYHGGGIKVDQVASRAGLGWALNAGGVIARTVRGKPDELPNGWLQVAGQLPAYNFLLPHEINAASGYTYAEEQIFLDFAKGEKDGHPDLFYVTLPGWSGKIIFDNAGNPIPLPYAKLKIAVDWNNYTWEITTADGIRYTFGQDARENTITIADCGESIPQGAITAWYLKSITSPNGDQIDLEYANVGLVQENLPRSETVYAPHTQNPTQPVCTGKAADVCGGQKNTQMVRLTAIRSARGSLEFGYDAQART
ncbi:MAG: hypothetical protein AAGN35_26860, partial [Bacteroidota bacterium]